MKFIFLALIFINLSNFYAEAQIRDCGGVEIDISQTAERIKKSFKDRDVSSDVEYIERTVQMCNVDIAKFGWGRGVFDYWKNTGYEVELERAKEQIEHYSKYRDVSPELERFKKFSLKLKIPQNEINKYYSQYLSLGKRSEVNEAKSCQSSIDLRNEALGVVRDQDSVGWCYAFAGADLLTYKLGKKVSAVDLAMKYNDGFINNLFKKAGDAEYDFEGASGSGTADAIEKLKSYGGACLEKDFKSEDNGNSDLLYHLKKIDDYKRKSASSEAGACPQSVGRLFPSIKDSEFISLAEITSRSALMATLSDRSCKPRLNISGIEVVHRTPSMFGKADELFEDINKQLENKNILKIGYGACLLYNRNHNGSGCGHASTVVGRRFNKKSSEC